MTGSVGPGGPHVLVVEDDESLRNGLCRYLDSQNLAATGVATLGAARELLRLHRFDVVVLDLNLGPEDGLDLARELAVQRRPPVVITSGRVEEADRIVGLELGADDYMTKPFSFRELLARIKGVLRRSAEPQRPVAHRRVARFDRWAVDITAHRATDESGKVVHLTVGELALLRAFLDHPNRVLLRNELLSLTRRDDAEVFSRTVDVLITRLRRKLEIDRHRPAFIRTVRGEGYLFDQHVSWEFLPS
jgi:two-component system OmpR family response regulator